jgi:branched-chain amino acid transport system permease protein
MNTGLPLNQPKRRISVHHLSYLILILLLLLVPLFFKESNSSLIIISNIAIMAVFAMSYDLLLGYTGIISFGHVMFFGIGAYTVGIFMKKFDYTWLYLFEALITVVIITATLSLLLGALTLRLKAHFFAMLTLAVAELFAVIGNKWRSVTNGADGFSFRVPDIFRDRLIFAYVAIIFMILIFFALRQFTLSPVGRILQGIRENEERMEALGYHILSYKIISFIVAGFIAGLAGMMYGIGTRFVSVPSVLGVDLTLDALLITIVGGVGTLFGAILGAGIIEVVSQMLQSLAKTYPIFERWLLFFGLAYILIVLFFPYGIVGTIRMIWEKRRYRRRGSKS